MNPFSSLSPQHRVFCAVLVLYVCGLSACSTPPETGYNADDPTGGNPEQQISLYAKSSFFDGQIATDATVARGLTGPIAAQIRNRKKKVTMDQRLTNHAIGVSLPSANQRNGNSGIGPLGSKIPPVTLLVSFQNIGSNTVTLDIRDVSSKLGNFVPQPEQLMLEPGQRAELEPMISRLGVIANEIPLQLSIRRAGQVETQTIMLHNRLPPPAPSPPEP